MKYIYTLSDPISFDIRYVGITNNPSNRYRQHLCTTSSKKSHCRSWILSLKNNNLQPIMEILDVCEDFLGELMEQYWISQIKSWGFDLTNLTVGGEGIGGFKFSQESLKKRSLNRVHKRPSEKSIQALVNYNKNGRTEEHRRNLSKAKKGKSSSNKGIPMSEEHKKKLSKVKMGKPATWRHRKVLQYSTNNVLIKEWINATVASKELNISRANIVACLKERRNKCGNYIWKYKI